MLKTNAKDQLTRNLFQLNQMSVQKVSDNQILIYKEHSNYTTHIFGTSKTWLL